MSGLGITGGGSKRCARRLRTAAGKGWTTGTTSSACATSPAKQLLLYVDGALAVSAPLADAFLGAMTNADGVPDLLTIGAARTSGSNAISVGYVGAIDEPAYYISALDASEIAAIYTAP
jgi:hypothetical protein